MIQTFEEIYIFEGITLNKLIRRPVTQTFEQIYIYVFEGITLNTLFRRQVTQILKKYIYIYI